MRQSNWEAVAPRTERLAVEGGWIYVTTDGTATMAAVFVPDPDHPSRVTMRLQEIQEAIDDLAKAMRMP